MSHASLQIQHKRVPCAKNEQSLVLTAVENTWIHGRQKRLDQNRQLREIPRALPGAAASPKLTIPQNSQTQQPSTHSKDNQEDPDKPAGAPTHKQQAVHLGANGCDSKGKSEKEPQIKEASSVPKDENCQDFNMESPISTTLPKHRVSALLPEKEVHFTPPLEELTSAPEGEAAIQRSEEHTSELQSR